MVLVFFDWIIWNKANQNENTIKVEIHYIGEDKILEILINGNWKWTWDGGELL